MSRKRPPPFLDDSSNLDAKFEAQKIAFGPLMFQAARALRELGILEVLKERGTAGTTEDELHAETGVSIYGLRVLLEAGLVGGLVALRDGAWMLTKVGYLVLADPMTRANVDFVHDVCYRPGFHLEASIRESRPAGLAEFGDWPTVYEGLAHLPEHVRHSWFAFDHYYSDGVFEEILPLVFEKRPKRIMDVGGNTGKWARLCCEYDPDVTVTIVDLPGQLDVALQGVRADGLADRISGVPCDLLDPESALPRDHDAIWMSQFLDCFGEDEIVSILERAAAAMRPGTPLYILETFWDLQRHEASRFSVVQTSLYFATVANGNSKMYHSERMIDCVRQAGLEVELVTKDIGISHTLMRCRLADSERDDRG
jgi:hypothetical protein